MNREWPPEPSKSASDTDRKQELRKELDSLNTKERVTKGGSMDHDKHEKEVLNREDEIRALEKQEAEQASEEVRADRIAEIRKRLTSLEKEAAQPRAGVLERVEPKILALEEEIRVLERNDAVENIAAAESSPRASKSSVEVAHPLDSEKANLAKLIEKYDSPSTTPETKQEIRERLKQLMQQVEGNQKPKSLTPEEQEALAKKFSPEAAAATIQSGILEADLSTEPAVEENIAADPSLTDPSGSAEKVDDEPAFMKKIKRPLDLKGKYGDAVIENTESGKVVKKIPATQKPAKKVSKQSLWAFIGGGAGIASLGALLGLVASPNTAEKTSAELKKNTQKPAATRTSAEASVPAPKMPSGVKVEQGKDGAPAKVIIERKATSKAEVLTAVPAVPSADTQSEAERTEWTKQFNIWMAKNYPQGYDAKKANKVRIEMVKGVEQVRSMKYPIDVASLPPADAEASTPLSPKSMPTHIQSEVTQQQRSAVESRRDRFPAPSLEASSTEARSGFEVKEGETHLYAIVDKGEPGGKALVLYGGGDTSSQAFVDKINEFARKYPNRAIYYNSGTSVYSATFDGSSVTANLIPRGGSLLEMQLDPATFVEMLG